MTREEAIFELGYAKDFATPKRVEAINVAIRSLEAWDKFFGAKVSLPDNIIGRYEDGFVTGIESAGLLAQQLLNEVEK